MTTLRKHRFAFIVAGLVAAAGAIAPLFLIAGCRTLQQTPHELQARETLRAMTRGGVLPAEDAVARIESDFPKTTAGALAKIVHARIKLNAKDFAGAAALLDAGTIRDYTVIGDYALSMRANALEQANRHVEARAAYEKVARDYPGSLRARDALLQDARLFMQDGQAAAIPVALKQLAARDDAAALLLTAKAYEQTGDSTRALAAYRRIYFFAPASAEASEAAGSITRLSSTLTAASTADDLHRTFPNSAWATRAFVQVGQLAEDAKSDASYFYRAAINFYSGAAEVAPAQFYLAWTAHDGKNFAESSRLLTEHLANYADRNTDFRGKAAYWAARDSERTGKLAEARAIYQGLQARYDANWYGYLAQQRLDTMNRNGNVPRKDFPADSLVGRAVASLQTVTVAEETTGPSDDERVGANDPRDRVGFAIMRADQLSIIGTDDLALEELGIASQFAPASPRLNLAIAKIYRARNDNVQALNILKRSYPDYSQMKPEEMRPDEWDIFYPLAYWDIIKQSARARSLDPYQVAGLIRQESVFNPRAVSSARAYGLMQVVVPTGILTAKKYGVDRTVTMESLFEPRLNIQLGTAFLRDQIDKYGRIEYVAAAYNAGPGRVVQWRASLPLELDEWAEAVPFCETRLYIQGVVRNTLQYKRLYDMSGNFRPEVGAHAVYPATKTAPSQPPDSTIRVRRAPSEEEE